MVVLLMLIPLLAPSDNGALGLSKIAKALGLAAVKAVVAIVTIIAGGRTLLRPLYRRIAALENTEIFAATTLLVVLGTSVMTQIAGLSLALGAFLVSSLLVVLTDPLPFDVLRCLYCNCPVLGSLRCDPACLSTIQYTTTRVAYQISTLVLFGGRSAQFTSLLLLNAKCPLCLPCLSSICLLKGTVSRASSEQCL